MYQNSNYSVENFPEEELESGEKSQKIKMYVEIRRDLYSFNTYKFLKFLFLWFPKCLQVLEIEMKIMLLVLNVL